MTVTEQMNRQIQGAQNDLLERIACGEPLRDIADLVCKYTDVLAPSIICSILAVDDDGALHPLAGPRLPEHYHASIDGVKIGPSAGSCGTAAWRGEPVASVDIENDPLWADFRDLPLGIGLKACWSSPIKARDGRVVGTFALYYKIARAPIDLERAIVQTFTHLCAIAIEQDEIRARNHRLAHRDPLTALNNRLSFNTAVAERLERGNRPFALILVDLDHFKIVNDTMGHAVGDALLCAIAERLAKASGPAARVFRLGGDEFAVIIDGAWSEQALHERASRLITEATASVRHEDIVINPDTSIGAVIHDASSTIDAATLAQHADFALYHAKENSRGSAVIFTAGMRTTITQRRNTISTFDNALAEDRVEPHYQPVVKIDTGEIVGLEALARLRLPNGDIVPAGQFQDAIADPRLAHRLTSVMLSRVAADLKTWLDQGLPFQHVGVNIASADFARGDLEKRIVDTFGYMGVSLKHLILEVTEGVVMNRDRRVARAICDLRASGMRIALDDFGTGHASLTHLLDFPVDILKIDRSFVERLLTDRRAFTIVSHVVAMAETLDMRIVAEGIETVEQADCLSEIGCALGQGYLYARPAPQALTGELLHRFIQKPEGFIVEPRRHSRMRSA